MTLCHRRNDRIVSQVTNFSPINLEREVNAEGWIQEVLHRAQKTEVGINVEGCLQEVPHRAQKAEVGINLEG
jgi:hypothetical protein